MGQTQRVGKVATKIREDNGYTCIRYHNTDVVKFNDKEIVLNSDGWRTMTTKTRMNQASSQFGLNFGVFQSKGDWFVQFGGHGEEGKTVDYEDNMLIIR